MPPAFLLLFFMPGSADPCIFFVVSGNFISIFLSVDRGDLFLRPRIQIMKIFFCLADNNR